MSEAKEIPGRGSKMWALRSFIQFGQFFNSKSLSWPEEQAAKLGAPIFFGHLVIPTVVVTDPIAAANILGAPRDVFDRLGNLGFGPLLLRPRIVGPIQPALVAKDEVNTEARHLIDAVLRDALPRFNDVLSSSVDEIGAAWASSGTVPFSTFNGVGSKIMGRWLMDIDLDFEEAAKWPKLAVHIKTRSSILNWLLDTFAGPGKAGIKSADSIWEQVRSAPRADHIRGIAKETGMDGDDALRQIAFMTLFNTAGLSTLMSRTLAQLAVTPEWAEAIRKEVGDQQLTLQNMSEMPVLRKVFVESSRCFSGPRLFYREALSASDVPCGDGNTYRVEKGDTVLVLKRSIHYNQMFTKPHVFNPNRFDDDPKLLSYVFTFGPNDRPYRCAASDMGFGEPFFMYLLGRLLQGWDWKLSQSPIINPDAGDCYTPSDLALTKFRARP